ncbi:MAG: hypothetical protein M9952_11020 [Microthrixaceae bacterium]|nr:hypothetical protein [Microthrixaceae bacterium]MCO5313449.1 hypothetical protein [Microthrixaceae bacterium]
MSERDESETDETDETDAMDTSDAAGDLDTGDETDESGDEVIHSDAELAAAEAEGDTIAEEFEEYVEYEMIGWSGESRTTLASMLTLNGIPHTWQGATLVVRLEDEDRVEPLLDEVNQSNDFGLDESKTRVVYEVGAWPAALQSSLAEALGIAEIPFEWDDDGDLVIYEDDEERVEEILDAMPDPDDPDAVDSDGIDVQAVLSNLWESTRTLSKKATDADATVTFLDGAERMSRLSLPFGFDGAVWRSIVAEVLELRDAMESDRATDVVTDDEVSDMAATISRSLRKFV